MGAEEEQKALEKAWRATKVEGAGTEAAEGLVALSSSGSEQVDTNKDNKRKRGEEAKTQAKVEAKVAAKAKAKSRT